MGAIGPRIAVTVDVGAVIHRLGEQRAVVPLLKLDGVSAAFLGDVEELLALLDAALMVVPDFRDHIAIAVVANPHAVNDKFSCHLSPPPQVQTLGDWNLQS